MEDLGLILAANIDARVADDGYSILVGEAGIPQLMLTANAAEKLAEELVVASRRARHGYTV